MVVLAALFLIIAIILMLVLLEKNTGGRDGGIGCVSGAILFGIFLLVMSCSQELKNHGQPNPISTVEGFLNALPTLLAWLVGGVLVICVLGGLGYLVHRVFKKEAGRASERDMWMDILVPLDQDEFDATSRANSDAINAAFRSEDWAELRRRRHGAGSGPASQSTGLRNWTWADDLAERAQWAPLVLIAAALLWQLGVGIARWSHSDQQAETNSVQTTRPRTSPTPPRRQASPADWMRRQDRY